MSPSASMIRRSIRALYVTEALQYADFTLGIYLLFFHNYVGLSYTQALSLYVVKLGVTILFDLFGGGFADAHGRKLSYRLGMCLSILAFNLPVIFVRDFFLLFVLAAIAGVGNALSSNTLSAATADLLEDDKPLFRKVNSRIQSVLFLSRAGASAVGGVLYLLFPPLPFIAEVVCYALAVICSYGIYEPAIEKAVELKTSAAGMVQSSLTHLRQTAPYVFKAAIFAALTSFLIGDIFFSYYQPFYTGHGYSSAELGAMLAAVSLVSAAGAWWLHRFQHKGFRASALFITATAIGINGLGFITDLPAIVIITMMLQAFTNGFAFPTLRLMVAESTPKRIRAATLSALTTVTSACTMIAFLASGLLADHGSPQLVGGIGITVIILTSIWFAKVSKEHLR